MAEVYGSIGIVAGIAQVVYLVTAFGVGGLLLARARRSGDLHQRLLGWHLILAMGLGYLLLSAVMAAIELQVETSAALRGSLVGLGNLATVAGLWATLAFTRDVFRPGDRRAAAAAWTLAAMMTGGLLAYALTGRLPTARYDSWGAGTMMAGIVGANLWISWEPLRYHRVMRRRLRLGLADPIVVDRFLLWGVGSASRLLLCVLGVGATLFTGTLAPAAALSFSQGVLVVTSALGLTASVAYWLAFHPTPAYRRWVERRLGPRPT